ncbi:MAG: hypothetical protein KGO50_10635, partial [Myxococcales bacterium]|nr:hypothetical protein [Myxococcales bacterium]
MVHSDWNFNPRQATSNADAAYRTQALGCSERRGSRREGAASRTLFWLRLVTSAVVVAVLFVGVLV